MTDDVRAVLGGSKRWAVEAADCLAFLRSLPDDAVSLALFSPPYEAQRTYSVGFALKGQAWVDWMRAVVAECCRVTDGLVCVNAAGPVADGKYSPSMEWLVADLTRLDGLVCGPAPWCWWKVCGIPGSGARRYQRRDWEPVYAFGKPASVPPKWTDNTAFGHPPKWNPGGDFSHRQADGTRVNDPWGKRGRGNNMGGRKANGEKKKGTRHTFRVPGADGDVTREQHYDPPAVADPGNVIQAGEDDGGRVIEARVGGGHIGHALAHESEAPMPLKVAERFVCWYCPPDGVVCDPFSGSGTTLHAAHRHGRRFVGCDVRESQVGLAKRRVDTVTPDMFAGVTA